MRAIRNALRGFSSSSSSRSSSTLPSNSCWAAIRSGLRVFSCSISTAMLRRVSSSTRRRWYWLISNRLAATSR
ncbi:hypothetical protein D3C80_1807670 [compost metagenome]